MWKRFKTTIREWLNPLATIAHELSILRELYEMDLASRTPPLIRITETPGRSDTTVSYGEEDENKGKLKDLMDAWNEDEEEV